MEHLCYICAIVCDCGEPTPDEPCYGCSTCAEVMGDDDPPDWIEPEDYLWDDDPDDPKEGD